MRRVPRAVAIGIVSTLVVLGLATTSAGASGPVTVKWYTAPQPGGSFAAAAAACTKAANGKYRIDLVPLPSDASVQREQLVRRLAAEDSDIDLISMDVIWTAEFGGAKWIVPWPRAIAREGRAGRHPGGAADGPLQEPDVRGPAQHG